MISKYDLSSMKSFFKGIHPIGMEHIDLKMRYIIENEFPDNKE